MTSFTWNPPPFETLNQEAERFYTLPEEFTTAISVAGLVINDKKPTASAFRTVLLGIERGFSTVAIGASTLGNSKVQAYTSRYTGWGNGLRTSTEERLKTVLEASGVKAYFLSPSTGWLYLAAAHRETLYDVPSPSDNRVNVMVLLPHGESDHYQHNDFIYAASGVLARALRPIASKVNINIGQDRFYYSVSASGLGITSTQDQDISDLHASLVSLSLFSTTYPRWQGIYTYPTVQEIFERLIIDVSIASPENLGLDRETWEYVGDRELLSDSMFYGFVEYARTCLPHIKQYMLARNDATVSKVLEGAFNWCTSFNQEINKAKAKALTDITKEVAVRRVLEALQGTDILDSSHAELAAVLASGDNTTVVLGSNLATIRDMALRLHAKMTSIAQDTIEQESAPL